MSPPRRLSLLRASPVFWLIAAAALFAEEPNAAEEPNGSKVAAPSICSPDSAERAALDALPSLDLEDEEHAMAAEHLGTILDDCPEILPEYQDLALALVTTGGGAPGRGTPGFWEERYPALARSVDQWSLVRRLPMLPTLWALEFRLLPVEQHPELRRRVERLAPRLRALARRDDDDWWRAVIAAYEIAREEAQVERLRAAWIEARPEARATMLDDHDSRAVGEELEEPAEIVSTPPAPKRELYFDTSFLQFQKAIEPLREMEIDDRNDREWTLADFQGKVTFMSFWTTWCEPCPGEMSLVQRLHDEIVDDDRFQVLSVNLDRNWVDVWRYFRGDGQGWRFPIVFADDYLRGAVDRIPQAWLVDPEGVVRLKRIGAGSNVTPEQWMKGMLLEMERLLESSRRASDEG